MMESTLVNGGTDGTTENPLFGDDNDNNQLFGSIDDEQDATQDITNGPTKANDLMDQLSTWSLSRI